MINSSRKKVLYLSVSVLILAGGLLVLLLRSEYLSPTHKNTESNILLLEGWVSKYTTELAYNEFLTGNYDYIITTGLDVPDYYMIPMNGFFVFYTDSILNKHAELTINKIEVLAYSEMGGEHCSHFNFYINDQMISDFCIGKRPQKYGITYSGKLSDIDSVMINFDNDALGDFGDHNMFVKEITINDTINISYKNNSLYNRIPEGWKKRIPINYTTYAGLARNRLIELGVDSGKIIDIPGTKLAANRTLSSAITLQHFLDTTSIPIDGINIISVDSHARRSLMTYQKIISYKDIRFGIISYPEKLKFRTPFMDKLNIIKEYFGLLYYRFILFLYEENIIRAS